MIRIARGDEPKGLKRARPRRLTKAVRAFNLHNGPSKALTETLAGYGSKTTKRALHRAQHEKCAWCELTTRFSSAPVEHYRPKDGAWRNLPGQAQINDKGHYWWLTWTWSNLLFSCVTCNDAEHKANYFPLRARTVGVLPPVAPLAVPPPTSSSLVDVSGEEPLLLDPAGSEDPLDHIEWLPGNKHLNRLEWIWTPSGRTEKGHATITILKLGELASRAQNHVCKELLPSIEEIEKHLKAGRIPDAHHRWDRLLKQSLNPSAELSGFTWHALKHLVPMNYRDQHGLADPPRPGAR